MNNYGQKISQEEYMNRIHEVYFGPNKKKFDDLIEEELNIDIDHRLGIRFPLGKRKELLEFKKIIMSNKLFLIKLKLIDCLTFGKLTFPYLRKYVLKGSINILNSKDIKDFLG